jgi:hypothetical protein
MTRNKKIIGPAITLIVIVLVGWLIFNQSIFRRVKTETAAVDLSQPPKEATISINAKTIPLLEPHPHVVGDFMFNPDHHQIVNSEVFVVKTDIWITAMEMVVANAPLTILHHSVLLSLNKPDPVCPISNRRLILFGSDTSLEPIIFPPDYGVFIAKGTKLVLNVMVHNPKPPFGPGELYRDVSIGLKLKVRQARADIQKKAVEYYQIAVEDAPCSIDVGNVFRVPPKSQHFIKTSSLKDPTIGVYVFKTDGRLLTMGAHLHAWSYGEELNVYLNEKLIKNFKSFQATKEPWSWTTRHQYYFDQELLIKKGDVLTIDARYSNPSDQPILDAMGMLGFYFLPN